jgi:iron complex outermembrane recepter protein
VFALATWQLAQPFSLTGGIRSSRVRFVTDDDFITDTNPDDSGRVGYSATSPVAGITWHARDNVNVFATIGRGFETPTFAELAYRPGATGLNDGLSASRSTHAEFGLKAQLSPSHRVDATLFASRTTDEIVVDTNVGGRTTFRNAGRTRRDGIELAWAGTLAPTVGVFVSASTLDARFRDPFATPAGQVEAGARIPGAPEWLHFAELAWRERGVASRVGWHAGVEMAGAGRTWVDDLNSDAAGRWLAAALRAGWDHRLGPWRFSVLARVDNVANRRYFGSVIVNESQRRFFEPAPGRRWLAVATLGYEFR